MRNHTVNHPTYVRPRPSPQQEARMEALARLFQAFFALAAGFLLFLILMGGLLAWFGSQHEGEVYPGVRVGGIDLSGLPLREATALLAMRLDFPARGQIYFQEGGQTWTARPADLGLVMDAQSSAQAAYNVGRSGGVWEQFSGRFSAWFGGVELSPVFLYNEQVALDYLKNLAAQIDKPVIEASLGRNGTEVVVRAGQVGRQVDVQAALEGLRLQLNTLTDGIIPLQVSETAPVILDVTEQAEIARRILSAPLVLSLPNPEEGDPGPWTYEPAALAEMLAIERVEDSGGGRYQVGLNTSTLRPFLADLAPKLARNPQNARFTFNDETRQLELIQPAVIGRALDADSSLQTINEKVAQGEHNITLVVNRTNPAVGNKASAEELGIRELVSEHTSYFYGSSGERIQNIQTASGRFHGLLVAPGEVFSMASILGDVSLDSGYAEALIIFGGRTIKGVGGGVCQVSTTLFRTVFFGGYPVQERYPHAYRVGYYEQTAGGGYDADLAGLDATVYVPVVDFKFTNNSSAWLLMETYANASARTLTWKFYSTSDGREVKWETSGPQNVEEPPDPLYEENPDLAKGEIKQVDWEAQGADVSVTRTVYDSSGAVLFQDTFNTHYMPWRSVYQYGPGTKGIPKQKPTQEPY